MLVSKIGDELAVRLSAEDAARLGLKEGDEVVVARRIAEPAISRHDPNVTPQEWLRSMERFRGMLPDDFKFNRDEANER